MYTVSKGKNQISRSNANWVQARDEVGQQDPSINIVNKQDIHENLFLNSSSSRASRNSCCIRLNPYLFTIAPLDAVSFKLSLISSIFSFAKLPKVYRHFGGDPLDIHSAVRMV